MKTRSLLTIGLLVAATAAIAHQGVQNAQVQARMDGMSTMAANMKILGEMAKGTVSFDEEAARNAVVEIAEQAAKTEELFRVMAEDPKSEAKSTIWENFDDFSLKSKNLEDVALARASAIESLADVRTTLGALGNSCKSCHSEYRE